MTGREAPINPDNILTVQQYTTGEVLDVGAGNVDVLGDVTLDVDPAVEPDVQADLTEGIPFADGAFETVIALHVLEHLPDDRGLWTEMQRVASERAIAMVPIGYRDDPDHEHVYESPDAAVERFGPDFTASSQWGAKFDLLVGVEL